MGDQTQPHATKWNPAKPGKDGIFLDEHQLPLNHRLRAEALAKAGATEDPGNQVSPELIADTKARLAAEAGGIATKPLAAQTVPQLRATGKAEQIPLPRKAKHAELVGEIERVRAERAAAAQDKADEGADQ